MSPFVAASAAIVAAAVTAASSVAVQPQIEAQSLPELDISSAAMLLAAASSPLNIPVNLLIDIANIPHYEVQALNYEAAAFFFTGSWWVSNATNVWGTDPGDPPKYMGGAMIGLPNPYLSTPVGKVLTAMAIAELPVNSTCGTTLCPPFSPFDPAGALAVYLGQAPFPIINNFFTVPLSALYTGYYLDPNDPGQQSFGGYVPTNPFGDEYPLEGTKPGPNGTYLQPWAGDTINLTDMTNQAWTDYVNHLMADPADNPIQVPTLTDVGRALVNLFASGVVSFNPFTPGMSWCPSCEWPNEITPEGIVGALSAADPGNTLLKAWLENHYWQASQGAPGDPTPTPSTPPPGEQTQQSVQPQLMAVDTSTPTLDTSTPALDSQPPASGDTGSQQQGRHAEPDPGPLAAINTAVKATAPTTSSGAENTTTTRKLGQNGADLGGGGGGVARSFTDRINDAVSKVSNGLTGGIKSGGTTKSGDTAKSDSKSGASGE